MDRNRINKMLKNVEDVLAAASFAEEGEGESARSLLKEGRRVLLALKQGRIDPKAVKYAANSAHRIGADLDLLYVSSSGGEDAGLEELVSGIAAEGIKYRVVRKSGCLKQAVIDYTNREKEIVFAVVESTESLEGDCRTEDSVLSELWQKLKCPLVVVTNQVQKKSTSKLAALKTCGLRAAVQNSLLGAVVRAGNYNHRD